MFFKSSRPEQNIGFFTNGTPAASDDSTVTLAWSQLWFGHWSGQFRHSLIRAGFSGAQRALNPFAFFDGVNPIDLWNLHRLFRTRRPVNLCRTRIGRVAQAEVQPPVIGGNIASARQ